MHEEGFDIRGILGLLRRQFRLILITFVLIVAVAGGAMLVIRPVYTASTLILVDPSRKDLLDPDAQIQNPSADGARVESEVELVRSETTLIRAIEELNLIEDPEFGVRLGFRDTLLAFLRIAEPTLPTGEAALQDVISRLRDALTVQRRGLTYLISVQVRSFDPRRAAVIAKLPAHLREAAYRSERLTADGAGNHGHWRERSSDDLQLLGRGLGH